MDTEEAMNLVEEIMALVEGQLDSRPQEPVEDQPTLPP
jgi:hypothetical protein